MAVLRQENFLGNQRVDIPHLRAIESAAAGDFDLLAGVMLAGRQALIISGFYVLSTGITKATNLKIRVKDSSVIHFLASESGSIFHVPADRTDEQLNSVNPRVLGSFTPGLVNYIGLDFIRSADESTVDLVEFIDSDTDLETPVQVPLARTLDYRIVISTLDFENNPSVCPIAKVQLDNDNNIQELIDARQIAFRLGSGGTVPNIANSYSWPAGRKENTTGDTFVGADKAIGDFKQWMDAVMTRLWEVGGGEYWYSPTSFQNEKLLRQGSPFVSNGEYFEWDGTHLHWQGLVWVWANSTSIYNVVQDQTTDQVGLTDLTPGECIYVDGNRVIEGATLSAVKGRLTDLGTPLIPGSRYVLAWNFGGTIYTRDQSYAVNSTFKNATVVAGGMVRISATPGSTFLPAYATTLDDLGFFACAGGMSRTSPDFVGGPGDLFIGGWGPGDGNVWLSTFDNTLQVIVEGQNDYLSFGTSALAVHQYSDFIANPDIRILTGKSFNSIDNQVEERFAFDGGGTQLWSIFQLGTAAPVPLTPPGGSTNPLFERTFVRQNATLSRDQYCVQGWEGTVTVLWESEPY